MGLAKALTSSVDVWLNNPLPPFEASGTSGMKAILNGVLQMSTPDGWVVEAEDKNIGKIFGYKAQAHKSGSEYDLHLEDDSRRLYSARRIWLSFITRLTIRAVWIYPLNG